MGFKEDTMLCRRANGDIEMTGEGAVTMPNKLALMLSCGDTDSGFVFSTGAGVGAGANTGANTGAGAGAGAGADTGAGAGADTGIVAANAP